ncbi:MAG: hypothetical protein IJW67_11675 [Blautia sp.]|nr:hypothetical protein [Blautia sp.]
MTEQEKNLMVSGQLMVKEATELSISNSEEYEAAGKILVDIKTKMKKVKDYWAEPKRVAKAAHTQLCDREKEMLQPLTDAEAIIKKSMMTYQQAVEKARLAEIEEAKRRQQKEADRMLEKAIQAQTEGNDIDAEINLAMAQMVSDMKPIDITEAPKAQGTSIRKTWKARVTDPAKVPAYVNGIEIRKIDLTALNRLAKMSSGQLQIEGVEFYEESSMSVRTATTPNFAKNAADFDPEF